MERPDKDIDSDWQQYQEILRAALGTNEVPETDSDEISDLLWLVENLAHEDKPEEQLTRWLKHAHNL